jgi:hypothetical protein
MLLVPVPFCSKSHVASVTTVVFLLDWFMGERQTLLPLKVDINIKQSKKIGALSKKYLRPRHATFS